MKKIISIIGLSIVFTVSPALAANLTDPIDPLPLTFAEPRKTYIKPFVGYGFLPTQSLLGVTFSNINSGAGAALTSQLQVNNILFGGIDIGRDINSYFGIEGEIRYQSLQGNRIDVSLSANDANTQLGALNLALQLPSVSAYSGMLKSNINIINSENFSFYITGGIGLSYGTCNYRDMKILTIAGQLGNNREVNDAVEMIEEEIRQLYPNVNIRDGIQRLLDYGVYRTNQYLAATLPNQSLPVLFGLSWMLGAGLTIDINDYTKFDMGYSYNVLCYFPISWFVDNSHNNNINLSIKDINIYYHSINLGVRIYF